MSAPRTLESFSKQDLIEFIKKSMAFYINGSERMVRELSWIEGNRKSNELGAKMDALQAEMAKCSLPQDWPKYKDLSDKWEAASRAWDRTHKGLV
jgi:hypothetical protein